MTLRTWAAVLLGVAMLKGQVYYPPPESAGGWRRCQQDDEIRKAGMDPQRLQLIGLSQSQVYGGLTPASVGTIQTLALLTFR